MARIDPTQLPDLPVPFMNADHEREAALVNQLEAAVAAHARGTGTLAEVVERLSLLAVHTHDRVLGEMDAEARIFREHGDAGRLSRYLFEALPAWFENHVRTMDVVTARFVAARDGATRQKL